MSDSIDDDGDGFCDAAACTDGSIPGDCDDTSTLGTVDGVAGLPLGQDSYPGKVLHISDINDGRDNDCSGAEECFLDSDGDGFGVSGIFIDDDGNNSCNDSGEAAVGGDCDDTDAQATMLQTWFYDCDADDYYREVPNICNPSTDTTSCTDGAAPDEFSLTTADFAGLDCDDNDPSLSPDTTEICDGIDNNCDGTIDEGCGGYDLYTCGGATFADGYTAHVNLDVPWAGIVFQAEDDVDGTCKDKKADGFSCTGSGNLITARIDDAVAFRAFDDAIDNYTLDLAVSAAGDPAYAVVHSDIFKPADCATPVSCNFDDVDQGEDLNLVDDTCYDSGFGGGDSADGNGYFDTAADSCEATFENIGEGVFAEGEPFSPNRPKKGGSPNRNWAMYVELTAVCQGGLLSVPAVDPAPVCDSAALSVDAIADGGDFDMDYIDAGDVTFTPDTDCSAVLECEDSLSPTECVFDD